MVRGGALAPPFGRETILPGLRTGGERSGRLPALSHRHGEPEAPHAGNGAHDQGRKLPTVPAAAATLAGHLPRLAATLSHSAVHDDAQVVDLAEGPLDTWQQEGPMRGKHHTPRRPCGPSAGAGRANAVGDPAIPGISLGQGCAAPRADGPHGGGYTAETPACQEVLLAAPAQAGTGVGDRFIGRLAVRYLLWYPDARSGVGTGRLPDASESTSSRDGGSR